jgi:hypothetical protein
MLNGDGVGDGMLAGISVNAHIDALSPDCSAAIDAAIPFQGFSCREIGALQVRGNLFFRSGQTAAGFRFRAVVRDRRSRRLPLPIALISGQLTVGRCRVRSA